MSVADLPGRPYPDRQRGRACTVRDKRHVRRAGLETRQRFLSGCHIRNVPCVQADTDEGDLGPSAQQHRFAGCQARDPGLCTAVMLVPADEQCHQHVYVEQVLHGKSDNAAHTSSAESTGEPGDEVMTSAPVFRDLTSRAFGAGGAAAANAVLRRYADTFWRRRRAAPRIARTSAGVALNVNVGMVLPYYRYGPAVKRQ